MNERVLAGRVAPVIGSSGGIEGPLARPLARRRTAVVGNKAVAWAMPMLFVDESSFVSDQVVTLDGSLPLG